MVKMRDQWSGTLMLIGQPAEERGPGASAMMADNLWERFGKPDVAFAFHVKSGGSRVKLLLMKAPLMPVRIQWISLFTV